MEGSGGGKRRSGLRRYYGRSLCSQVTGGIVCGTLSILMPVFCKLEYEGLGGLVEFF
jgi:hypothetical protein